MEILIVTPAPSGSQKGNRVTALRWARLLRELGHGVGIEVEYAGQAADLLVALHARRSFPSVERYHGEHPERPLLVALTGTDVYGDIHTSAEARQSLEWATRLLALQPEAARELPLPLREKVRVIFQSAEPPPEPLPPRDDVFQVCVLGHLRPVKDPFRAAEAARLAPATSRLLVVQVGAALSEDMAAAATAEAAANPRYRWLGELPREEALQVLSESSLLVLTSELEGGANVVSEALAAGAPVISSHIAGSVGILGAEYPGYFPVGETAALADLLRRAETDPHFYGELKAHCDRLSPLVSPDRERETWRRLLEELALP
ncbi:MAG TPA: selenoneine biosynthesis selenosugar synthase SenB, partial [Armatimonadota bacterium]|nr:selenoneine biosynthesis selenosugar synthase SenB [Armatimonadota bacterium]